MNSNHLALEASDVVALPRLSGEEVYVPLEPEPSATVMVSVVVVVLLVAAAGVYLLFRKK